MSDILYRIGQPDITQGTYRFQDSPNACGYKQTITITGLPSFVTHDDQLREFTIAQSYDHSQVGEHPVKITVTIEVPDDYTKSTYRTYTLEQNFNIIVEPCLVTSLDIVTPLSDVFYQVASGSPDVVTDSYLFVQNPDCRYTLSITMSPIPTHILYSETD